MMKDVIFKVVWVDDQNFDDENELTSFYDSWQSRADNYNIELVPFYNWEEAEQALLKEFDEFSAIILDANCKIHKGDIEQEEFITAVLPSLTNIFGKKRKVLPWYMLSAATMSNFDQVVNGARYQHSKHEEEWGNMLYLKNADKNNPQSYTKLFDNIVRVAKDQALNVVLYRHYDTFYYMGKDKLIDQEARKILIRMLCAIYYPEDNSYYVYEGNPLRKVMEYVFRSANQKGLLPMECIERDGQINLLESNRYMSGKNTRHSHLRYGMAGTGSEGLGGDTIFPTFLGHITKAIIEFGSIDSHTNEAFPYTIDDKDLSLTENEKDLFFSYVLQLCHIIKFYGKFVEEHPDVSANKAMKKVLDVIPACASDYEGYEGVIRQDSGNNYFCEKCVLSYSAAKNHLGKKVKLYDVRENTKSTKTQYPLFAQFKVL